MWHDSRAGNLRSFEKGSDMTGEKYVECLKETWANATDGRSWEMWLEAKLAELWDQLESAYREHSSEMHMMAKEVTREIKEAKREAYAEAEREMRHEYRGNALYGEW